MLIVTDFEATCFERGSISDDAYQEFLTRQEIIEIGSCFVDEETLEVVHRISLLISPKFHEISPFCKNLTGISQELVKNGAPFADALDSWTSLCPKGSIFCSWGAWDWNILAKNCGYWDLAHIPESVFFGHRNIKQLVADKLGLKKTKGLKPVTDYLGIGFEGDLHRGLDDAENIVRVLKELRSRGQALTL